MVVFMIDSILGIIINGGLHVVIDCILEIKIDDGLKDKVSYVLEFVLIALHWLY
jgi:hypothetical protein